MKFEFDLDAFDLEFFGEIIHTHHKRCLTSLVKCYTKPDKGFHKGRTRAWIKRDLARVKRLNAKIFESKEVVGTTRVDDYPDQDIEVYRLQFELNSAEIMYLRRLLDSKRTKYLQLFANTYLTPEKAGNGEMWTAEQIRPYYEFNLKRVDLIDTLMFGEIEYVFRDIYGTET